jgi:pyruvate dehydrogenase E1 component alpha subunit
MITNEEFDTMDDEAKNISAQAADFAENSDEPPLESLYEDVLV